MGLAAYSVSACVWGLTALLLSLLIIPVGRFLATGWVQKRRDIVCGLTEPAIELYFREFYPTEHVTESVCEAFENHFDKRFGRHHFTFPALFLIVVAGLAIFMLSAAVAVWLDILPKEAGKIPDVAAAAFAGAYMWLLGDLITRNRCMNLAPSDLSWGAFRFVTAIPFGYSFSQIFPEEDMAIPIAFLIGCFPTLTLRRVAGRLASRQLKIGEFGEPGASELERLQGIDTSKAEVFADEGVTTILELAYSDPIDLTIRTSMGFSYVVDCMSQALAWIYFEDKLKTLRKYSLRGAQEIASFISEIDDSENSAARVRATTSLQFIEKELGQDSVSLERTLREIARDPYTRFLVNAWKAEMTTSEESRRSGLH